MLSKLLSEVSFPSWRPLGTVTYFFQKIKGIYFIYLKHFKLW